MDRLEEVKKILESNEQLIAHDYGVPNQEVNELARQICQLFEPKPDESRLLTDEEIIEAYIDGESNDPECPHTFECFMNVAKAQLAKDQAHEEARVVRIFEQFDDFCPHGARATQSQRECERCWRALKKQELGHE